MLLTSIVVGVNSQAMRANDLSDKSPTDVREAAYDLMNASLLHFSDRLRGSGVYRCRFLASFLARTVLPTSGWES